MNNNLQLSKQDPKLSKEPLQANGETTNHIPGANKNQNSLKKIQTILVTAILSVSGVLLFQSF